jgi:hypothetical protein
MLLEPAVVGSSGSRSQKATAVLRQEIAGWNAPPVLAAHAPAE